jgi:hypothetical protein
VGERPGVTSQRPPSNDGPEDARARLIFDQTASGLGRQSGKVDEARSRAAGLLTIGTFALAFLGSSASANDLTLSAPGWVAIVGFGVSTMLALFVLWPRAWSFQDTTAAMITNDWIANRSINDMLLGMAETLAGYYASNETKLSWIYRAIAVQCAVLGGVVICLFLNLQTGVVNSSWQTSP